MPAAPKDPLQNGLAVMWQQNHPEKWKTEPPPRNFFESLRIPELQPVD